MSLLLSRKKGEVGTDAVWVLEAVPCLCHFPNLIRGDRSSDPGGVIGQLPVGFALTGELLGGDFRASHEAVSMQKAGA